MQTTHHAGKIAAIQQSFVPRIVASHLLLSRKQVSPSFTSPAHLVVRQKKSKLLLDSLHAWWRKMPRYPKIQTGRMVQLCTESVGRTLLLQCWRSGGGRHNAAEKPFVPSVSEIKLYVLRRRAQCTVVWAYRHLPSERHWSGSVSAPYPERTAGITFQPYWWTPAMERSSHQ